MFIVYWSGGDGPSIFQLKDRGKSKESVINYGQSESVSEYDD